MILQCKLLRIRPDNSGPVTFSSGFLLAFLMGAVVLLVGCAAPADGPAPPDYQSTVQVLLPTAEPTAPPKAAEPTAPPTPAARATEPTAPPTPAAKAAGPTAPPSPAARATEPAAPPTPAARATEPPTSTNTPPPTATQRPTYTPHPVPQADSTAADTRGRETSIPFEARLLDGTDLAFADTIGSPTLLAFWAPW